MESMAGAYTRLDRAETTASATAQNAAFFELGDRCPELELDVPTDTGAGNLTLTGTLVWPGDPEPGRRIAELRVRTVLNDPTSDLALLRPIINDDGSFAAGIPGHIAFGEGDAAPAIVAALIDGTEVLGSVTPEAGTYSVEVPVRWDVVSTWGLAVEGTVAFSMEGTGIVLNDINMFTGYPVYEFNVTPGTRVTWTAVVDVQLASETFEPPPQDEYREQYRFHSLVLRDAAANGTARMEGGTVVFDGFTATADFTLDADRMVNNQFYVPLVAEVSVEVTRTWTDGRVETFDSGTYPAYLVSFDVDTL